MENCYEREIGGDLYRLMQHDRDKTPPKPCNNCPPPPKPHCPPKKRGIEGLFGSMRTEDLIIIGVIVLLMSEHADWDIIVIIGILYLLK